MKRATKAEKEHLKWVASNPCCICGSVEIQIHHIRLHGEQRNHYQVIPLCYKHHLWSEGIHFLGKRRFRELFGHEMDYWRKLEEMKANVF